MHPSLIQHFSQLWLLWTVLFSSSTRAEPAFPATFSLAALDAASGFRLDGEKLDYSGISVSHAGDINGDGLDDLIVGAWQTESIGRAGLPYAGRSYVIYGRLGGLPHPYALSELNATMGFRLDGEQARDYSGLSVSHAGDINGDGLDDLIVGSYWADPNGQSKAGSSYVIYGRLGGLPHPYALSELNATMGFRIDGEKMEGRSGASVSRAGDINGDGLDDLIVGAWGALSISNGQLTDNSFVIYGRLGGLPHPYALSELNATMGFRLDAEFYGITSGASVSYAGDVNGDSVDDIIVGTWWARPNRQTSSGSSYVLYGRLGGLPHPYSLSELNATMGFRLDGEKSGDYSGRSVSHAGDINGDGFDDLIVGANLAEPNGLMSAGSSYVIYGRLGGLPHPYSLSELNATMGFRLDGEKAGDSSGASVSRAGDINGDGLDDLIIGAPLASPNDQTKAGSSYVIYGRLGGLPHPYALSELNATVGFRLDGEKMEDRSGGSVSRAGDINGDGLDDLIVGANFASPNNQSQAGSSYVIYGRKGKPAQSTSSQSILVTTQKRVSTSNTLTATNTASPGMSVVASPALTISSMSADSIEVGSSSPTSSIPSSAVNEITSLPSSGITEGATFSTLNSVSSSPPSNLGFIAGTAAGGAALLCSVAALGVFACRRRTQPSPGNKAEESTSLSPLPPSSSSSEKHIYGAIQVNRPEGHYSNPEVQPEGVHYLSNSEAAQVLREAAEYAEFASVQNEQLRARGYDDITVLAGPR